MGLYLPNLGAYPARLHPDVQPRYLMEAVGGGGGDGRHGVGQHVHDARQHAACRCEQERPIGKYGTPRREARRLMCGAVAIEANV